MNLLQNASKPMKMKNKIFTKLRKINKEDSLSGQSKLKEFISVNSKKTILITQSVSFVHPIYYPMVVEYVPQDIVNVNSKIANILVRGGYAKEVCGEHEKN